jgi:hypothetical protein
MVLIDDVMVKGVLAHFENITLSQWTHISLIPEIQNP